MRLAFSNIAENDWLRLYYPLAKIKSSICLNGSNLQPITDLILPEEILAKIKC